MSAPPRPEGFVIGERVKPARIHIDDSVLLGKVEKVFVKTFAGICQPRGGGQSRARADNNRVGVIELFSYLFNLLRVILGTFLLR